MSLEKLDTETRKRQIAEAAFQLIAIRGTSGLSISEIAKRVGIVPSALYRHFKNKDEIMNAVIDLIKEGLTGIARDSAAETPDPLDQLKRLVVKHAKFIMNNSALPRIMFSEDVIAGKNQRRDKVFEAQTAYISEIMKIIARGQKMGMIRPELDPGTAAVMFIGIALPAGMIWHTSSGRFDILRQVEGAWKIYLSAIKA